MNKVYQITITVMVLLSLLAGCSQIGLGSVSSDSTDNSDNQNSSNAAETIGHRVSESAGSSFNAAQTVYIDLNKLTSKTDDSGDTEITAVKTKYFNDTVTVDFTKYNGMSNGVIRVDLADASRSTAVNLSGSNDAVKGIKIKTSKSYQNGLVLNGVVIKSGNFPCIEMTKKGSVNVQLIGTNILTDGRKYGIGYGEEYSTVSGKTYEDDDGETLPCTVVRSAEADGSDAKGTLYASGDMTVYGSGSLMVTQGYKNCIASKMILSIEDGTYTLTSTGKAGLYGDYGVIVKGGKITFSGDGEISSDAFRKTHGIAADDDTYKDAFITLAGGSLNITTDSGRGMTAPYLTISGGTHSVTNTGTVSYLAGTGIVSYYNADGESRSYTLNYSPEGIQGDAAVNVTGGSMTITAPATGIDANGTFSITGGTLTIAASVDGVYDTSARDYTSAGCIKVSGNMTVSGGIITGTNTGSGGKGIKVGGTYTQSGGNVTLTVSGSNLGSNGGSYGGPGKSSSSSSASASAKGIKVIGNMSVSGGKLYADSKNNEAIETKGTLTVTGGEVYGCSTGDDAINAASTLTISGGKVCGYSSANDGIDANGDMYIQGGLVYAVCTTTPEVALDANTESGYKLYIQGGTVITLGPLESGALLTQGCYSASWSANSAYGVTVGDTTYVFNTPSDTRSYGSGMVVSGLSNPTVTSGASISGGTSLFGGKMYEGGLPGNSSVSLNSYSSGSSMMGGPGGGGHGLRP